MYLRNFAPLSGARASALQFDRPNVPRIQSHSDRRLLSGRGGQAQVHIVRVNLDLGLRKPCQIWFRGIRLFADHPLVIIYYQDRRKLFSLW